MKLLVDLKDMDQILILIQDNDCKWLIINLSCLMTWPSSFLPSLHKGPHTEYGRSEPGRARKTRWGSPVGSKPSLWCRFTDLPSPHPTLPWILNHSCHRDWGTSCKSFNNCQMNSNLFYNTKKCHQKRTVKRSHRKYFQ